MKKNMILFVIGATVFPIMELAWQGHTHYVMSLAGGLCLMFINIFCYDKVNHLAMGTKCAVGSVIITIIELIVGVVFNILLNMNIWDYSELPLNLYGQISLPFTLVWFLITIPALYICEAVDKNFTFEKTVSDIETERRSASL